MKLENKVAVVTGASSGVGREIALLFAKEGAKVVAVARRAERLAALEEQSKELAGEIVAYAGDISLEETNTKMIDFATEKFGKLDILINNAGLMDNFAPAETLDTEFVGSYPDENDADVPKWENITECVQEEIPGDVEDETT